MTKVATTRHASQWVGRHRAGAAAWAPSVGRRVAAIWRRTGAYSAGVRAATGRAGATAAGASVLALAGTMTKLSRVSFVGRDEVLSAKAAGRRIVYVSWHGLDLCNLGLYPRFYGEDESRAVIMAPTTTWTGRVMEQVAASLGHQVIPIGTESNSPDSARGVVKMVSKIKDGYDGMIAVDGPCGPPQVVKIGAAVIAKRASAVIVPTVVAGSRELRVRSRWDKHLLIPPFAHIVAHLGPLIDTCPSAETAPSEHDIRDRIDAALRDGAQRARAMADAAANGKA